MLTQKISTAILLFCLASVNAVPVDGPGKINDLQTLDPYQPEKAPNIPVLLGERSRLNGILRSSNPR